MKLSLGFSPCPNDTFIFDAMVNHKIDTEGLSFDVQLEDVQTLNEWALQGKLDFSKISYGVLPLSLKNYLVLQSGGALGKGVGPLLIASPGIFKRELNKEELTSYINKAIVAIPGENTTAHMLFSLAFPGAKNKVFKVFNEIEDAVLNKDADAGVIIHENRFTYHLKGLYKLIDLGEYWEKETRMPIPLGGIVANRTIDQSIILKVDSVIKKSIAYAYKYHYDELASYVKDYAQEMSESIMRQHIDLYVNNYSIEIGEEGKNAVLKLLDVYQQMHPEISIPQQNIFSS